MCKFCEEKMLVEDKFSDSKYGNITLEIENQKLIIWDGDLCIAQFDINYCPLCGEKMEEVVE